MLTSYAFLDVDMAGKGRYLSVKNSTVKMNPLIQCTSRIFIEWRKHFVIWDTVKS